MEYSKSVLSNMIWKDKDDTYKKLVSGSKSEDSDVDEGNVRHKKSGLKIEQSGDTSSTSYGETPSGSSAKFRSFHEPVESEGKYGKKHSGKMLHGVVRDVSSADAAMGRPHDKVWTTDPRKEKKSIDDFDLEKTSRQSKHKAGIAASADELHSNVDDLKGEYERRDLMSGKNKAEQEKMKDEMPGGDPSASRAVRADMRRSIDSFLNKSFENRQALPELFFKDKVVRTTTPEENAKIDEAIKRRKKFDEGKARAQGAYKQVLKEGAMKRSYTIDETTVATLLKGHPEAQEILDQLLKGKKKNESGEEFQDGSEDTIGAEGHEANLRGVDHKTGGGGHPGTSAKNASLEDGDLAKSDDADDDDEGEDTEKSAEGDVEKSDNLADNLPEEFEDEMEEDDTIPAESSKKSIDDFTVEFLVKTMGQEKADEFLKAVIGGRNVDPGQVAKKNTENPKEEGNVAGGGPLRGQNNPLTNRKINTSALAALKNRLGTGGAGKSKGESDLEKGEGGQKQERAEWAKSPEKERKEHMSGKSWSMDFSKSILENMGLEKGSPSVSKKVAGGKATQISYSTKPETRFKHPKQKTGEVRWEHNNKEDTVTKKEATGEKGKFKEGKPIDISDEKRLKNASEGDFDLHKALDEILEKKTSR